MNTLKKTDLFVGFFQFYALILSIMMYEQYAYIKQTYITTTHYFLTLGIILIFAWMIIYWNE